MRVSGWLNIYDLNEKLSTVLRSPSQISKSCVLRYWSWSTVLFLMWGRKVFRCHLLHYLRGFRQCHLYEWTCYLFYLFLLYSVILCAYWTIAFIQRICDTNSPSSRFIMNTSCSPLHFSSGSNSNYSAICSWTCSGRTSWDADLKFEAPIDPGLNCVEPDQRAAVDLGVAFFTFISSTVRWSNRILRSQPPPGDTLLKCRTNLFSRDVALFILKQAQRWP